jgi:hypothetical protein
VFEAAILKPSDYIVKNADFSMQISYMNVNG